ncbi:GntR family transcriptional regulator [Kallotenue papyrolyticum]|uniref:GntR family transcriptional regulator n=1 Tax=Kallotenue papyrolyticum TaxID=1325125 RepID=UPI0004712019|nr:GntR family transcriptional regulator [Kallotenue papyrolyticum]
MHVSGLDRASAVPLYLQLKQWLELQIASGQLAPHSRVPSERELSEQFAISRMTARQALAELIQEGRLYTRAGKGTFVAEPKIRQNLQALTGFTEDMRARGLVPRTRVLAQQIVPATGPIAQALNVPEETPVLRLQRLRLADDAPMALENSTLHVPDLEQLLACDLSGSLYAVLRERFAIVPAEAIQEFEAALPQPHERALLQVPEGAPVLKIQRTTFDARGQPFEYVASIYRGDRYRFVARLVREGQP